MLSQQDFHKSQLQATPVRGSLWKKS
jgi:hypothetical protein